MRRNVPEKKEQATCAAPLTANDEGPETPSSIHRGLLTETLTIGLFPFYGRADSRKGP